MIQRVVICGLGLIGGSIALGLKERTETHVIGYDCSEESIEFAVQTGMIDQGFTQLAPAAEKADVIVIALPVGAIKQTIAELRQIPLKTTCIVTDVGSTKSEIVDAGQTLSEQGITFIGGHPMAGSHRSGVKAADALLFENAYYVLTPDTQTKHTAIDALCELLTQATKSTVITMDAAEHDRIVGAISHLPHIIAAGLVVQVGNYNKQNDWFHRLAAGGFRDLTRIAASHPIMWRDVLLSNREEVIQLLDDWMQQMKSFQHAVHSYDAKQLEELFTKAQTLREQLPEKESSFLHQIYECYVNVPDHPGVIGSIATVLGDRGINVSNIGIMENREDLPGVLRLSFKERWDYEQAVQILERVGYTVFADPETVVKQMNGQQ